MSTFAVLESPAVASTGSATKRSHYSLAHVFAMPIAFVLILVLTRLAAG